MATVLFKRKTATEISSLPIEDGSLIFNTTDKDILMDNGTERERYGGGNLSTTDIVNDVATAIAVTETDVPAGCGTIKELNTLISDINSSLTALGVIKSYENRNTTLDGMSSAANLIPFTVVEPGLYEVSTNLFGFANTSGRFMAVVKKGTKSVTAEFNGFGYYGIQVSQVYECIAGDVISGGFFSSVAQTSTQNNLLCQIIRIR